MDLPAVSRTAALPRILLLLLILSPAGLPAAGLYSGQVTVTSQGDAERAEALKSALGQVVIHVSGDPGALAKAPVAKAVAQAERYVQQFHYEQSVVTEGGQAQERLTLVAQFDRDAVDQLLRSLGLVKETAGDGEAVAASPVESTPGTFHLWVGGVRSPQDYARMIGTLSGNEFVRDLQVELARGDGVQLRVATVTPLPRLLELLNTGSVMRVTNAKPPVEGIDALLDLKP